MKLNIFSGAILMAAAVGFTLSSCDTDVEKIDVQHLYTYDAQYYDNLRQWKKSPHEISYMYYASWHNSQQPTSYGERFLGLPDSIDIVNLWWDIPTEESYPVATEDMKYCQRVKGTRFVMHGDASNYNHYFWDRTWNAEKKQFEYVYQTDENGKQLTDSAGNPVHKLVKSESGNEETLRSYARWAVDTLMQCGLDGVDFDFEGWGSGDMAIVANECNKYIGPYTDGEEFQNKPWPEKLFIIDWFGSAPDGCDDYCNYFIRQAYTWQIGFQTGTGGRPVEKTVFCESTGAEAGTSGINGAMVRDYARWEPSTGRKGGFGCFYGDYNYMSQSGIPYKEFREAIQIANPAVHK